MSIEITRRQVVERAMYGAGFATIGSTTLIAACSSQPSRSRAAQYTSFRPDDVAWLDEVAETILPATETPGAKEAGVGGFIALMVEDTYSPEKQQRFRAGMTELEAECRTEAGVGFMAAMPAQRLALLARLDREAFNQKGSEPHYFRMLKELTTLGYFTSEIGYTQAMRYVESPGRFDPCVEFTPGEKVWARHA